jgi:hypothetical protein
MADQRLRVSVAGRDRSHDLGVAVVRDAGGLRHPWLERQLSDEREVLALSSAGSAAAFRARHLEALRSRCAVDLDRFSTPSGPGLAGALALWARTLLWRFFRYQHDWVAFHQNAVNAQQYYALLFESEERARQVRELEARVRELEAQVGTASRPEGPGP